MAKTKEEKAAAKQRKIHNEQQRRYNEARRAAGVRRISITVGPDRVDEVVTAHNKLKKKWAKEDAKAA